METAICEPGVVQQYHDADRNGELDRCGKHGAREAKSGKQRLVEQYCADGGDRKEQNSQARLQADMRESFGNHAHCVTGAEFW